MRLLYEFDEFIFIKIDQAFLPQVDLAVDHRIVEELNSEARFLQIQAAFVTRRLTSRILEVHARLTQRMPADVYHEFH
jgi:hypothetical protein